MSQSFDFDRSEGFVIANADADTRAVFIAKTYFNLFGAIIAFIIVEAGLLATGLGVPFLNFVASNRAVGPLIMLGLLIGGGFVSRMLANSSRSLGAQYVGLGLYVVVEAIFFMPIMTIALHPNYLNNPTLVLAAAGTTFVLFGALTAVVFITRQNFSFLRSVLIFGSIAAIGFFVVMIFFPAAVGGLFIYVIYAMIALMCLWILYDTSKVLHEYGEGQHVAAALELFVSVITLFYYILILFMNSRD